MNIAGYYKEKNNTEKALETYSKIAKFDSTKISNVSPEFYSNEIEGLNDIKSKAHSMKALIYRTKQNDYKKALEEFDAALKINKENDNALMGKSLTLLRLDNRDEAREILTKLVVKNSKLKEIAQKHLERIGDQ